MSSWVMVLAFSLTVAHAERLTSKGPGCEIACAVTLDLSSCSLKLARAEEHRQALEADLGPGFGRAPVFENEANRVLIVAELDPDSGEHIVSVVEFPPPLQRRMWQWALTIGDAIHNLRSSLDHLAL